MSTAGLRSGQQVAEHEGSHRRLDIQGLRGVAVVLVVAFHAGLPLPGGFVGVDIFFVISGFVITALLLRELGSSSRLDLRRFYARRARRLLPALALMLLVVAIAAMFLLSPLGSQQQSAKTGAAAATFSANLNLYRAKLGGYFDPTQSTNAFLHTWSLAVEEQFYLVFPIFLLVAWAWASRASERNRKARAAGVIMLGTVASFCLSVALTSGHAISGVQKPAVFAFYSAPTRAWEFGVGALLAFVAPRATHLNRSLAVLLGCLGLVLVVAASRLIDAGTAFPGTAALVPVLGSALLILAGTATGAGVSRVLSVKPAVWLGEISYGWYLWHWPAIVIAAALWYRHSSFFLPLVAVAALIPTWLSYRFVERPIRYGTKYVGRRTLAVAGICILIPLVATATLGHIARSDASTATVRGLQRQLRQHGESVPGVHCDNGTLGQTCVSKPTQGRRGIVWLVGDSQAGSLIEPVSSAVQRQGFGVHVAVDYGCPFLDELLIQHAAPGTQFPFGGQACLKFVHRAINEITRASPNLVIIVTAIYAGGFELRDPLTHETARSDNAKSRLWQAGLSRVLTQFKDASIPTLVVNPIPRFPHWDPRLCPSAAIFTDIARCGASRNRADVVSENRPTLVAQQQATSAAGTDAVDFMDELCGATRCSTNRGKFFLYRDSIHLSVDGALTLTDNFDRLIAADARQ